MRVQTGMQVDFLTFFRLSAAARQDFSGLVGIDYVVMKGRLDRQDWQEREQLRLRNLEFQKSVDPALHAKGESGEQAGKDETPSHY